MSFRTELNTAGTSARCFLGSKHVATVGKKEGHWVAVGEGGGVLLKLPHTASKPHQEPGYKAIRIVTKMPLGVFIAELQKGFAAVSY